MQTINDKLFNEICYFNFKLNEIIEKEKNIYKEERNGKMFFFSFWSWYRTSPLFLLGYMILTGYFVLAATQSQENSELFFIIIAFILVFFIFFIFVLDVLKLFNMADKTLQLQAKTNNLLTKYHPYNKEQFYLLKDKLEKTKSAIVYNHFLSEWISIEFRCKPCK